MNGIYGTKKPANITYKDVDIFYFYRPSRSVNKADFQAWKKIDSSFLSTTKCSNNNVEDTLVGMYDLKLPLEYFNEVGIYNIYIKPKEIPCKITDVSVLSAYPNVKGIVLDLTDISKNDEYSTEDFVNGGLVGYRVEFLNNGKRTKEFRVITSNNKCQPLTQSTNNGHTKDVTYAFNDLSNNLFFCTVTPSTSLSFKNISQPFIGSVGQDILLVNTKFNPIAIEVEMTDKDIEGIATMLEGKQIRNLEKGLITTFDKNGDIYNQTAYGNIFNKSEGVNHDFKIPNTTIIDFGEKTYLNKIEENINE